MIIRIQSPDGQHRINIDQSKAGFAIESLKMIPICDFSNQYKTWKTNFDLYAEAKKVINIEKSWTLFLDRQKSSPFTNGRTKLTLKHGEMLYLFFNSGK